MTIFEVEVNSYSGGTVFSSEYTVSGTVFTGGQYSLSTVSYFQTLILDHNQKTLHHSPVESVLLGLAHKLLQP